MSTNLVDLWPNEISVSVRSPKAILGYQAVQLGKRTNGILDGYLKESIRNGCRNVSLIVRAPLVESESQLLRIESPADRAYPVKVFGPGMEREGLGVDYSDYSTASGEAELNELLRISFASDETRSLLQSLIALSNDNAVRGDDPDGNGSVEF